MILQKAKPENKGFTLLEMMIVIAIIGIGTALAVTNYVGQIENIRVKGDIRELEQEIQRAKMFAITENVPYGIVFNRDDNTYFIFRDNVQNGVFTNSGPLLDNTDPDSNTEDFIPDIRVGAGGNNLRLKQIYSRQKGGTLVKLNQFTCILGSDNTAGLEQIVFNSMGAVTSSVVGKAVIAIQRVPDASGGEKPRGYIYIHLNTGLTETVLVQPAPVTDWCGASIGLP
jgi:prepilin-type N-terminal cleavage/methylation domain-containing protein